MKMTTGRKIALALSLTAATLAGGAYAQQAVQKADRDAPATRAQVQAKAQERFARMDVNKDGKIDQADRTARQAERRAAAFARLDTDKNGQISRAEFDAGRPEGRDGRGGPGADRGPDGRGDRGGHGKHRWGGRGGHDGGMMAGMADANKDGAVTQAEFTAAALQRFDRADANKDGTVTVEERRAARQAMRDEMRQRWQDRTGQAPAAPKTN